MNQFLLLFRQPDDDYREASKEQLQEIFKKWQEWISKIEAQDRIVSHGQRLNKEGKVLRPGGVITDGPFVEIKEKLGGFIIVKAESLDEATTLAHGCPALNTGGSVEIRQLFE